jgi:type II secretory pathway pseudopilin PulG
LPFALYKYAAPMGLKKAALALNSMAAHPGPLPRERENGLPRGAGFRAGGAGAPHGGYSAPQHERAFTMVEIAICLAIIGFALVAIIGILPAGLQVQKENREDTLVGQDGEYFMEAIRSGAMGLNNLVGTVETITIRDGAGNPITYQTLFPGSNYIGTGHDVIGLLSYPWNYPANAVAIVRAIAGAAAETGQSSDLAFRYQLTVQQLNYSNSLPELDPNFQVSSYLHDLRLEFRWPVHANGSVGNGRQVFRALVSGTLSNDPPGSPFYFFRP